MTEEKEITRNNQEICPNCLEPNNDDLANCAFCGMPLHGNPGSVELSSEYSDAKTETGALPVQTASAEGTADSSDPSKAKNKKDEKINRGFTYAMRGMGLYLVIYSITELPRSLKLENPQDRKLAVFGDIIYLVAGCLMAWPLLKDYLDKRKKKLESTIEDKSIESPQSVDNMDEPHETEVIELSANDTDFVEAEEQNGTPETTENSEKTDD